MRRFSAKRRALISEYKSVPCADCGVEYPPYVMQFDHLRDKLYEIADNYRMALDKLLIEIEKCDVVCANCHAERTERRRSGRDE